MKRRTILFLLAAVMLCAMTACTKNQPTVPAPAPDAAQAPAVNETEAKELKDATINVFIAASLNGCFEEIVKLYAASHPNITVNLNPDSSGKLLKQIEEGSACDIFFSASTKQINELEEKGLMVAGSRVDLLENILSVITWKGSGTAVTGLSELGKAKSLALADASVPAGNYTRIALNKLGILSDPDADTAAVSQALGGVEINECSNVSKVKEAIKEHSNEVGTVYYSDAYSIKDDIDVIEKVSTELTGEVVYPVVRVVNREANEDVNAAADDFMAFLETPEVLKLFEDFMFTVHKK